MKKYLVILLLFVPLSFSGCFRFDDIRFIAVKDVTYREFKNNVLRIDITATVDNPNRFNVKLKDASMDLKLNDRTIGTVMQVEHVELAGRTKQDYEIRVSIEMKDMPGNLVSLYRMLMNDMRKLNLSGSVHVKSFLYSKTFRIDKLSFQ